MLSARHGEQRCLSGAPFTQLRARAHYRWAGCPLGTRIEMLELGVWVVPVLRAHLAHFFLVERMAPAGPFFGGVSGVSNLNKILSELSDSYNKLSSGKRISKASDDAAALAIASRLEASLGQLEQGARNVRDAGSALAIADGAVSQIQDISGRLQELSIQSANGTYSDEQRADMKSEYDSLSQEIGRIAATTEFNGVKLLDGSQISVQVGTGSGASSQLSVGGADISSLVSQVQSQDIGTQAGSKTAITALQNFSQSLGSIRSSAIGASQARLDTVEQNIGSQRIGQSEAFSRIVDLDFASQSALRTAEQIRTSSSISLLAQTNRLNGSLVQRLLG